MTPQAMNVAAVLDELARSANVSPAETSLAAAQSVCAVLVSSGVRIDPRESSDPMSCAIAVWLRRAAKLGDPWSGTGLLVTTERVVLRHRGAGGAQTELIPLPAVVAVAVALVGALRAVGLYARGAA